MGRLRRDRREAALQDSMMVVSRFVYATRFGVTLKYRLFGVQREVVACTPSLLSYSC